LRVPGRAMDACRHGDANRRSAGAGLEGRLSRRRRLS
jgi:hypothetical protein